MKFSNTTKCFYPEDIGYSNLPEDLIAVTQEQYAAAMVRNVGDTLDVISGELVIIPAPLKSDLELVEDAKKVQRALLGGACAAAITGGFKSFALGSMHIYPSTQTDQANLNTNAVSSLAPDLSDSWRTRQMCCDVDGAWGYVLHTAAQIQLVHSDGKAHIFECLAKNADLQAQLDAATTVDAVQAIQWPR